MLLVMIPSSMNSVVGSGRPSPRPPTTESSESRVDRQEEARCLLSKFRERKMNVFMDRHACRPFARVARHSAVFHNIVFLCLCICLISRREGPVLCSTRLVRLNLCQFYLSLYLSLSLYLYLSSTLKCKGFADCVLLHHTNRKLAA